MVLSIFEWLLALFFAVIGAACKKLCGLISSQIARILSTKLSLTVRANPLASSVSDAFVSSFYWHSTISLDYGVGFGASCERISTKFISSIGYSATLSILLLSVPLWSFDNSDDLCAVSSFCSSADAWSDFYWGRFKAWELSRFQSISKAFRSE